jgi:hypothetical protein
VVIWAFKDVAKSVNTAFTITVLYFILHLMKIAMLMDARNPVFGGGTTNIKFLSTLLVQNHKCNVDVFVRKLKDQEGKTYTNDEQKFGGKWRLFRI